MKIKIILFICTIITFSSCTDFINYNESSSYGASDVFTVYSRASQMALNIYTYLPSDFNSVGGAMRSSGCDESEYVWPSSNIHVFYDGTWSAINTVDDVWSYYYKAIRAANLFLEEGANQTFPDNQYVSGYNTMMVRYNNLQYEVRFLRALFYFELLKRYGGVPLVTKVLTPDAANQLARDSYQKVSDFIVHECDTCAANLPNFYNATYNGETGRATRAAALALKARVLLYAASDLHNQPGISELNGFTAGDQKQRWKDAALAAKVLIDSGAVFKINKLTVPYDKIPNNIALPELIFANRLPNSGTFESLNFPIGFVGGHTGNCPTQNLVDAYEMKSTGAQFDWNNPTMTSNPYSNRDPRLALTVVLNNTTWVDNQVAQIWQGGNSGLPLVGATNTGYYLKKYVDKNISFQPGGVTSTRHVWVLFRYGEVLLNYAEAMNEAFGPNYTDGTFTLSAVAALNLLRSRPGLGLVPIPTTISQSDFRTKVRNERMVELAFEDHRFWDIRRWMIGPQTIAIKRTIITKDPVSGNFTYSTVTTHDRKWDDKMYFYPISQAEIYKDKNLTQNPGW